MKILANDGISQSGIDLLKKFGYQVFTKNIPQNELIDFIKTNNISVLLVRSATTARKDLVDSCNSIKIIGRGGVGMDNIDVNYALKKGIKIINTPAASSTSVAELVFAHMYGGVRFLHNSNSSMPLKGDSNFKNLKKNYAKGVELRGKTLGIIGLGRIGIEVAKIGIGIGMNVIAYDNYIKKSSIELKLFNDQSINVNIITQSKTSLLKQSNFITLHIPAQKEYVIGENEFSIMKNGSGIINASRGGVIDENALIKALDSNKLSFAALDTFENEPKPSIKILMHPKISLSPHIGAATLEAQERIGIELATQIIEILK